MFTDRDEGLAVHHGNHQALDSPATGPNADTHAIVLKELSAALSQAAEILERTDLGNGDPKVEHGIDFYDEVTRFETRLIRSALRHTKGSQKRAAKLLSVRVTTLNAMIKRYSIGFKPNY